MRIARNGFSLHAEPGRYREAVDFIRRDPLALGALVTTHKIDLCAACRDQLRRAGSALGRWARSAVCDKREGEAHARAVDCGPRAMPSMLSFR
jgi:hypothetical protein